MEEGFLLINKPKDWTSHDVVGYVRNRIRKSVNQDYPNIRKLKVGHAGTLDPFATGLLIVGVGREATKRLDEFKALPKTYIATIKLGATSTTFDPEGEITITTHLPAMLVPIKSGLQAGDSHNTTQKDIEETLQNFIGKQQQIPSMFSAKKVGGQKLYDLARKGIEIERQPCEIEIYDIKLLDYNYPTLKIEVGCSTGTYIRTLAHDIGQKLGCGAYCEELERTRIGKYLLDNAIRVEDLKNDKLQNLNVK